LPGDLFIGFGRGVRVEPQRGGGLQDGFGHRSLDRALQTLDDGPGAWPSKERAVADLVRDPSLGERLLERLGAGVDAVQHRDLLQGNAFLLVETPHGAHDRRHLGRLVRHRPRHGLRAHRLGGPQRLAEPTKTRSDAIGHPQDLRRRTVVLFEPNHGGMREPAGEPQEVRRRCAGERIDGLVVVADHTDLVATAEPPVEECGLQRVHVLELVDGERSKPFPNLGDGLRMIVEQPDGQGQHVFEVEPAHGPLASLIPVVDPQHELRRDGRLVPAQLGQVAGRRDHPILRPLDLSGQLATGEELVRGRQAARQRGDDRCLVVEDLGNPLADVFRPEPGEL
jgi:hypothetical protein